MAAKEPKGNSSSCEKTKEQFETNIRNYDGFQNKIDLFSIGVLNSISAHIAVVDIDGSIIAVNEAWKQFEVKNNDGKDVISVGSNYFAVCAQAAKEEDQDAVHALNGIKQVLDGKLKEFEYEYACHSPDEKRWFLMRVTPMLFMGNKAVVSHINITDKKLAEMNLLEREKELFSLNIIGRTMSSSISLEEVVNAAIEQISKTINPDVAMLFIRDGEELLLNGMGPKDKSGNYTINHVHKVGQCLCGLSVSSEESIFSLNINSDARCSWRECKVAGFTSFAAIPLIRKNEVIGTLGIGSIEKRDFESRRQFLEAIVSHIAICLDNSLLYEKAKTYAGNLERELSDRKKMEKALIQTQKMEAIGTLSGGIAHDFNNILMGIQGRASLMETEVGNNPSHQEHIHAIEGYVRSATNLTKQLLGIARGGKYEVKPLDVHELLRSSAALFGRTRKEIRITTKVHTSPLVIEVDQRQIEQVLLNIFINAWQAMPDGGDLYLETSSVQLGDEVCKLNQIEPGRYVKIMVTDTGIGMDLATQHRIFDPFFTTKDKGRGTGLGLASAYGIIKNHGGMITVDSVPGHGATFSVHLPVSEKEASHKEVQNKEVIRGAETILLVDDEEMIIEVGKTMLERLGYRVMIANSGKEAVETISSMGIGIDLVLLDLIMPEWDGGKTFDHIRDIQPDLPVILSSGYAINGQATEIVDRGCNGFIQKPFNLSELSQKVRKVLDEAKS